MTAGRPADRLKSQIPNSKSQTKSKFQIQNEFFFLGAERARQHDSTASRRHDSTKARAGEARSVDSLGLSLPVGLAEFSFQNFSGASLGQGVEEVDAFRNLKPGQMFSAVLDELFL